MQPIHREELVPVGWGSRPSVTRLEGFQNGGNGIGENSGVAWPLARRTARAAVEALRHALDGLSSR